MAQRLNIDTPLSRWWWRPVGIGHIERWMRPLLHRLGLVRCFVLPVVMRPAQPTGVVRPLTTGFLAAALLPKQPLSVGVVVRLAQAFAVAAPVAAVSLTDRPLAYLRLDLDRHVSLGIAIGMPAPVMGTAPVTRIDVAVAGRNATCVSHQPLRCSPPPAAWLPPTAS